MLGFISIASRAIEVKSTFIATAIDEAIETTMKMRSGTRTLGRLAIDSNVAPGLEKTPMMRSNVFGFSGSAAEGGTTSAAVICAVLLLCRGLRSSANCTCPTR